VDTDIPELPYRCEIELSSACNLRCIYCPRRFLNDIDSFMSFNFFKKVIDELAVNPDIILVLHRRGESLLHPQFIEILDYIQGKFKSVQLATNATLLDKRKSQKIIDSVSFISFSIDLPEEFERTRLPARYEDTVQKINYFLELNNGKIRTQVSMVQTSERPPEDSERFKRIWSGKVDRIRIYEEHSADGKFGSLRKLRRQRVPCAMPFYEMLVYVNGKVGRCNHDWDGSPLGDLNGCSVKEVWHSAQYDKLRAQHMNLKIVDPVCSECDCWYPVAGSQMTGDTYETTP
jgi:hypothetical protein